MTSDKPRSVFATRTGKSAIAAAIAGIVTVITPDIADIVERHAPIDARDVQNVENMILGLSGFFSIGGAFGAILGRASANDKVTSPGWMPGHNEQDLIPKDSDLS